ncbi:hypothetical protein RHMOL_Rhmol04G0369000 [Rhododendron molle]|uniref:Uncharacterized protein n=1 Tax=Rhododendron molle TaxID=49168 RepID=A0ACC0PAP2_RHOML|nr:hypothetical protein RHMOL_Rhmol04G0369000 [Rhododendron molle]
MAIWVFQVWVSRRLEKVVSIFLFPQLFWLDSVGNLHPLISICSCLCCIDWWRGSRRPASPGLAGSAGVVVWWAVGDGCDGGDWKRSSGSDWLLIYWMASRSGGDDVISAMAVMGSPVVADGCWTAVDRLILIQPGPKFLTNSSNQPSSGTDVSFWEDKWIPYLHRFKLSSTKPLDCEISTVSDVIKPGLGAWDMEKMQGILSEEEIKAIFTIALPSLPCSDRLIWHYNSQVSSIVHLEGKKRSNLQPYIQRWILCLQSLRASKARCEFEEISPAQREVLEYQNAPTLANTAWRKPLPGSVKINCDVAVPSQGIYGNSSNGSP